MRSLKIYREADNGGGYRILVSNRMSVAGGDPPSEFPSCCSSDDLLSTSILHRRSSWMEIDKMEQDQGQGQGQLVLGRAGSGDAINQPCCAKTDPYPHVPRPCCAKTAAPCLSITRKGLRQTAVPVCIIFTFMLFLAKILPAPRIISLVHDARDESVSFPDDSILTEAQLNRARAQNNRVLAEADRASASSSPEIIKGADKRRHSKIDLWQDPKSDGFRQCIDPPHPRIKRVEEGADGYILVNANGGLNQMRNGICDMVAIAKILNASLVVPYLDQSSFWADSSKFKDIFDVQHFMDALAYDVHIVPSLPPGLVAAEIPRKAPASWSKAPYYKNRIAPLLKKNRAVLFTHSDSRLSNNGLPRSIQGLRCRACYKALRFTEPIQKLGMKLVHRMRHHGEEQQDLYIALHLRYEKDMIAFTGCATGLSEEEALELREMRYKTRHWKEKKIDGEKRRRQGGCPLTPRETALLLIALGYPRSTRIYIVAGEIYGKGSMDILRAHFPNTFTHSTLATTQELHALRKYQNRLAALDYTVALESDVFLYTYGGNMAKAVQGHRRFAGYRKTIAPDRRRLVHLVEDLDDGRITWLEFETKVRQLHEGRNGGPEPRQTGGSPKSQEYFYSNPFPGCICNGTLDHYRNNTGENNSIPPVEGPRFPF